MVKPLWLAFRAAVIATAVFWALLTIVDKSGWQFPMACRGSPNHLSSSSCSSSA